MIVPDIDGNLLSVNRLTELGFIVLFEKNKCKIQNEENILIKGFVQNNLYTLKTKIRNTNTTYEINLLHRIFGYKHVDAIRLLDRNNLSDRYCR